MISCSTAGLAVHAGVARHLDHVHLHTTLHIELVSVTISLNLAMKSSKDTRETAWMRQLRAWYQTSPLGSPVAAIILGTSSTCQKIVPSRTNSTLSAVLTLYSKNAYCARRSIFVTGTL